MQIEPPRLASHRRLPILSFALLAALLSLLLAACAAPVQPAAQPAVPDAPTADAAWHPTPSGPRPDCTAGRAPDRTTGVEPWSAPFVSRHRS